MIKKKQLPQSRSASTMPDSMVAKQAENWRPHNYQKKAIQFLLEHAAAGLFLDPGLGKTSITLGAIRILKREGIINRVLIIAPLRVCYSVWPREVEKWADFNHLRIEILHGSDKDKAIRRDADIYVINPEGLDWLLTDGRMKVLDADTLVIDESSKFKHPNTRRFKNIKPTLPRFKRRWILTGTPAPNGLMDLFGQVYILDLGKSLSPYISHFRREFFEQTGFGGFTWVPKHGAEEMIHELLRPMTLRLSAEDYLDMPELIQNNVFVDVPEKAMRVYKELEEHLIAQLEGGDVVTAMSAAAASMKCRQVANGGLYRQPEDPVATKGERWAHLHDAKTEAVLDLVEELSGQPVLIAYDFEHDRDRLLKALGKDTPYIGGGVSAKASKEIEAAWNAGEIPVLLGHPQAMGHGLNLQESGGHIIWHSLTWDYELYDQFIRRIWRQGNTGKHVIVHHVVARDTIDEAILKSLKVKKKTQNALLSALKDYAKVRKPISKI